MWIRWYLSHDRICKDVLDFWVLHSFILQKHQEDWLTTQNLKQQMQKEHESIFQHGYLSFLQFVLAYFSSVGLVDLFNAPANVAPRERLKMLVCKFMQTYTKQLGYWYCIASLPPNTIKQFLVIRIKL